MDTLRRRYVALRVQGPASAPELEDAVLRALRGLGGASGQAVVPKLYHLRPGAAIARVDHRVQQEARARLDGLRVGGATVRTATTSGTLRQAKLALGVRSSARRRRSRGTIPKGSAGSAERPSGQPGTLK